MKHSSVAGIDELLITRMIVEACKMYLCVIVLDGNFTGSPLCSLAFYNLQFIAML